jgi:hypothetical protein
MVSKGCPESNTTGTERDILDLSADVAVYIFAIFMLLCVIEVLLCSINCLHNSRGRLRLGTGGEFL